MEVKESNSACAPGNNYYSSDTVSFNAATQELTLEYKNIGGTWRAGEVRILLGETASFDYGEFTLHVKSVSVYDGSTLVSNKLPPDMVFGFFTFDTTVSHFEHPYGKEVDFEISHWGDVTNEDVQFLIQPGGVPGPHFPYDKRFFSGGSPQTFDQGGHFYKITWNPGEISWSTDAGGTHTYSYTSDLAHEKCVEDFIQCLPNNVEVRLNLWNMGGGDLQPNFEQIGRAHV